LISQAEHDVIAAAVLVTDSPELAKAVEAELKVRVNATKHSDRIKTALSGVQSAIALVDSIEQGLDVVNAYAAEHLEIQTRNSRSDAAKIRNAGAVFIGRFSPVSLGDYSAGSNHVLPTGGCACHSSGLSVQTFLRGLHFIEYGQKAFTEIDAAMLQRFVTRVLYLLGASHRYHLVIIQLVQTTFCLLAVALVTQVDYLYRHFCVGCTSLSMAKTLLQRSSIPL